MRKKNIMRPVRFDSFPSQAAGCVQVSFGNTVVACSASVAADTPRWIEKDENGNPLHGWVSAEYAMLPGSTQERKRRGSDGRSTEIQRLIGRSLRAAVDMEKMPGLSIMVDCDVLCADGGTRTAAITGGWVALAIAIERAMATGRIAQNPLTGQVAARLYRIVEREAECRYSPVRDADVTVGGPGRRDNARAPYDRVEFHCADSLSITSDSAEDRPTETFGTGLQARPTNRVSR